MSEDKRTDEEIEDLVGTDNDGLEPETRSYLHKSRKRLHKIILGVTTVVGLGVATGIYVNSEETDEVLPLAESSLVKESGSKEITEESSVNVESAVSESEVSVIEEPVVSEETSETVTNPDSSVSNDNPVPDGSYAPTNSDTLQAFLNGKELSFQESGLFVSLQSDLSVRMDIDMDYPVGVAMYNTFDTARTTGDNSKWVNLQKVYDAYSLESYELSATPYVFNVYDPYTNELIYSTSMGQPLVDNVSK
jgi:hypothetical protein